MNAPETTAPAWTIENALMHENGYSMVVESTTARYLGFGEFYSGLHNGDTVTVSRTTYFRPDGSVSRVSLAARSTGAWLSVPESALQF